MEEAEELMEGALVLVDPPGGLESGDFKRRATLGFRSPAGAGAMERQSMRYARSRTCPHDSKNLSQCMGVTLIAAGVFLLGELISSLIKLCRVCPDVCTRTILS